MKTRVVLPPGVDLPAGHLTAHLPTTVDGLLERLTLAKNHLTRRDRELLDEARDAIFELAHRKHDAEVALAAERLARRRRLSATEILQAPVATAIGRDGPTVINHDIEVPERAAGETHG